MQRDWLDRLGLDEEDAGDDDDDDDDGGGGGGEGGGDGGGGSDGSQAAGNPFPTDTSNVPILPNTGTPDCGGDGCGGALVFNTGGNSAISTGDSSADAAPSDGGSTSVASGTGSDSVAGDILLGVMLLGNVPEVGTFANAALAGYYLAKGQYGQAALFGGAAIYSTFGGVGGSEIAEGVEALRAAETIGETALEASAETTAEASGFGTTAFGNEIHQGFGDVLAEQTGTNLEDWQMATRPGQTGVDATYVGPASTNPGFNYAELKPVGYSQEAVGSQIGRWGLPEGQTSVWWYNSNGIIGMQGMFW